MKRYKKGRLINVIMNDCDDNGHPIGPLVWQRVPFGDPQYALEAMTTERFMDSVRVGGTT